MLQMDTLCSLLACKATLQQRRHKKQKMHAGQDLYQKNPHGCIWHHLAMGTHLQLCLTHLKNEGWADGGVEGAHAIEDSVTGLQISQQGGVGVREDLVVPLPTLMP